MEVLRHIGSFVCHQISDRTLHIVGHSLPLCARCTGIYSGFLLGIIYHMLIGSRKNSQLPPMKILLTSIGFIMLLIADGLAFQLGLWNSTNYMRLLLGLLCGSSISLFLLPLYNHFLRKNVLNKPVIETWLKYRGMFLVIGILFSLYFINHICIFYFLSIFSILGLLLEYLMMNTTFAAIIINYKKRNPTFANITMLIAVTLILISGEIWLLKIIHS